MASTYLRHAGLLAVSIAFAYAELAARFPRAGGDLVFAYATSADYPI